MHLITMAHLGEAQSTIEKFNLRKITPSFYESDKIVCLITGEGPFEAAIATASTLAQKKISKVINIGIAGAVDQKFTIGEIYPVRSIYLVIEGRPQFKTFQSKEKGFDCLTSFERILSAKKVQILQGLGELVDREAWGVAMASKSAQVPFEAYKLVSDYAGGIGTCELIKSEAIHWSSKIADYLEPHLTETRKAEQSFELEGFYFTFSTELRFRDILKKLALRANKSLESVLKELPLEELRQQKTIPKERTKILLTLMEEKLNPLKHILDQKLNSWKGPWVDKGFQLQTDPQWEAPHVKISFSVQDEHELNQKLKQLNTLDVKTFHDLRNGKIHVE